jgi:hypothetical protein
MSSLSSVAGPRAAPVPATSAARRVSLPTQARRRRTHADVSRHGAGSDDDDDDDTDTASVPVPPLTEAVPLSALAAGPAPATPAQQSGPVLSASTPSAAADSTLAPLGKRPRAPLALTTSSAAAAASAAALRRRSGSSSGSSDGGSRRSGSSSSSSSRSRSGSSAGGADADAAVAGSSSGGTDVGAGAGSSDKGPEFDYLHEYASEIEFLMRRAVNVDEDEVPSYIS